MTEFGKGKHTGASRPSGWDGTPVATTEVVTKRGPRVEGSAPGVRSTTLRVMIVIALILVFGAVWLAKAPDQR
jgi:hypothetical protein